MGLLFARVGAARTAGRWSGGRGILFGIRSPDRVHEVDAMLALAGTLGCRPENAIPELWIPECSRQSAMGRLREVGLAAGEPFAVLNAGSYKEEARLPLPKAVEIGRDFSRELRLPLLLTGVVSESARVEAVCQEIGPVARSIAGRTDLLELAAIFERARVVVTTDSGPMHVATAMGAPLVVLFGPGDPTRFGPRGRPGQVVILQGKRRPHDPRTWHADLPAAEVVAAAHRLVADPHPPSRM
jgi:ADP-heptose:LPS heptosyltransferase